MTTDPEGARPTDPTCSVPGCKNPATTTALDTGAPVCRKCADTAARDWEAQQREDDTIDAIEELLPVGQVPPGLRGGIKSLFFEGRDRAAKSTPGVLRTCQALAGMDEWAGLDAAIKAIVARQAGLLIGRDAAAAVLGTFDRRTRTWADAPTEAPAADDGDLVQTFADMEADDGALSEVMFPTIAYRSRAVLLFGHRGQSEDPHTWRAALPRMGAFLQNVSYARAVDMARPGILEKHAEGFDWVVVDNWRTWGLATDPAFDFNGDTAVGAAAGRLVALTDGEGPALTIIANTGHHDESRSKGSAALEEAVHATRKVTLDGELSIIEPTPNTKTREGIDRDAVTLRARLDAAGRPEAYWLESRGPGVPTPDPDGTTPPKGWTSKHAAFLEAWNLDNPRRGSARQAESDMREAGLKARSQTIRERLKCVRDARDARDAPTNPMHAEGASLRPSLGSGRRDAPAAGDAAVRPDENQGPAVSEGVAFDPGAAFEGAVGSDEGEIETMTDEARAAAQAETAAMVDDWAAGGERAEARMRDNALKGLDATIPDWQDRAEKLGLDGDLMKWTEPQWQAIMAREIAA